MKSFMNWPPYINYSPQIKLIFSNGQKIMGVAHQFCLSHQICCPIPATIKNCFTSLKGLCGVLFVLVLWWLYSRTTDAQWSLFSLKFQTFRLGQTIWADNFWGNWGFFGQLMSTHFCFTLNLNSHPQNWDTLFYSFQNIDV